MENQNIYIGEDLKGMHTVRVGMETRITPSFSIRAGYNYSTSAFKETAYKALEYNDMRTDTEYTNSSDGTRLQSDSDMVARFFMLTWHISLIPINLISMLSVPML